MTDDLTEKIIAASEPAAWARLEPHYPASYRSTYVRRAHRLGFEAGIEFARIALQASVPIGVPQPTEQESSDG